MMRELPYFIGNSHNYSNIHKFALLATLFISFLLISRHKNVYIAIYNTGDNSYEISFYI